MFCFIFMVWFYKIKHISKMHTQIIWQCIFILITFYAYFWDLFSVYKRKYTEKNLITWKIKTNLLEYRLKSSFNQTNHTCLWLSFASPYFCPIYLFSLITEIHFSHKTKLKINNKNTKVPISLTAFERYADSERWCKNKKHKPEILIEIYNQ